MLFASAGGGSDGGGIDGRDSSGRGGGGGDGHGDGGGEDNAGDKNRAEALMVLKEAGRSLESVPKDLAAAIRAGRIPGLVVTRFLELEKFGILRWLLQFGGFKERLLADDLFLAKVAMECGVGIFTKVLLFLSLSLTQQAPKGFLFFFFFHFLGSKDCIFMIRGLISDLGCTNLRISVVNLGGNCLKVYVYLFNLGRWGERRECT